MPPSVLNKDCNKSNCKECKGSIIKDTVYNAILYMATHKVDGMLVMNGRDVQNAVNLNLINQKQADSIINEIRKNENT